MHSDKLTSTVQQPSIDIPQSTATNPITHTNYNALRETQDSIPTYLRVTEILMKHVAMTEYILIKHHMTPGLCYCYVVSGHIWTSTQKLSLSWGEQSRVKIRFRIFSILCISVTKLESIAPTVTEVLPRVHTHILDHTICKLRFCTGVWSFHKLQSAYYKCIFTCSDLKHLRRRNTKVGTC